MLEGKAMESGSTAKDGGAKLAIVSNDAYNAYKEATDGNKNVMLTYLKKRIVAYIAVAVVLYMLLSGNLSLIVEIVLKALNGVFDFAEEFAADQL